MKPSRHTPLKVALRWFAAVAPVAALLDAPPALAQQAQQAPGVTEIVPPRLDPIPEVPYPEGGEGDAEVVLLLVVERDGTVRSVEVQSGEEPFASAAKRAAESFRLTPGTRKGEPVVSRVRFALGFKAPQPVEEPEEPEVAQPATSQPGAGQPGASQGAGGKPAPPPEPEPIEVVVRAEKPPPSAKTLTRAEVRQLPGAFGDPFRAIEVLPGVTPIASGLPYFYIRGAPPGNIGYYLDGVRVPYLFHAAAGPSVIHPGLVERVDLYSGGYPARFGRFSGAIVSAETTEPNPDFHGEGNFRLVDVGALVEGSFADGRGTALASARYSYTAAVISLISPELRLDYRDYQARVTYDITPRDRLTLFAFGSYDLLAQELNGIETVIFGSEFYRVDGRYDVRLPNEGRLRWAATWGFDQTRIADQRNARDLLGGTRVELNQPINENLTVRSGFDVLFDGYKADQATYGDREDPDVAAYNRLFPSRTDAVATLWADAVWRPNRNVEFTPGIRTDVFHSNGAYAVGFDPRLGLRVDVTRRLRLLHAIGLAHQPPSFIIPIPGLAIANLRDGLQRSLQTAAGVEVDLPAKITATVTVFNNLFLNMSDTAGVQPPGNDQNQVPRSLGVSRGLEVYIRRNLTQHLGGFISYTLARSTRTIGNFTFPFAFDRTHVFNAALSYDLGRGWRAGSRFTFYTGVPNFQTPPGMPEGFRLLSPEREPGFYRLDARIEKKWTLGRTTWLSFVIEALNATLNKETINGNEVGPVTVPSLGLEGGF
ncbi:TonB-dependent receptor plug domain-containing protein [Chondromyces crocatus]|uniref:TonB family protein n=1 Tax=Chondromyces crocatus TaxID=52 RepID=A0A0K1EJQ2_CHOCO|nr:TonB-dependent receptor plug domain-containing protein [Chondromyces crocatus]AKT41080.1 tonB family protein [Chondromyces crocatus]